MPGTISREQALAVLCDLAFTIGGEVSVAPLLAKTLQRFLYHTGFPVGLMLSSAGIMETAIGDYRLARHRGEALDLPASLRPDCAQLIQSAEALGGLDCSVPMTVALALPVPGYGHMLLISPRLPPTALPLTTLFEPLLPRLGTAVTLCREYERQTEARRRILIEAIEQSPVSIIITDAEGTIEYVNATFCATTGYAAAEAIGQNPRIMQSGEKPHEEYAALWATIKRGDVWRGEFHNRKKDGNLFWENAVIAPVRDHEGRIGHFVGVKEDITEKKTREADLRRLVEHLTEVNTELERFAYVASHDLREPLRTIASFTQLLERRYSGRLDTDADEYVSLIVEGAKRMDALINDLLAYSRVTNRGSAFGPADAERACQLAVDNLRDSIQDAGAEVTVHSLPIVVGDEVQLMQLFQNLIGNAVKFHSAGVAPRVVVANGMSDDDHWQFSVTDNGIGIQATDQDIFEIFRRLNPPNQYPGTGLGLAICKRIVQRHGGRIWYESNPGGGTVFRFTLSAKVAGGDGPESRPT